MAVHHTALPYPGFPPISPSTQPPWSSAIVPPKSKGAWLVCECVVEGWLAEHERIPHLSPLHYPSGPESDQILALTSRWESLNSDVYPGAGPGTLTPDGRLDPLLAYAYDAVFALAGGIRAEQATAKLWGASLRGFVTERSVTVRAAVGEGSVAAEFFRDVTFGLKVTYAHHHSSRHRLASHQSRRDSSYDPGYIPGNADMVILLSPSGVRRRTVYHVARNESFDRRLRLLQFRACPPASCRSCPFRTEGLWEDGEFIRSSILDMDFMGATGNVKFTGGENLVSNGLGKAGSGWRNANQTTFCGVNLQAHASLGATFATMWAWRPEQRSGTTSTTGFEVAIDGDWRVIRFCTAKPSGC